MKNFIKITKDIVLMTFATFIVAFAVYFFLVPSHAAVSSISGLAIVLANFIPLTVSQLTMIMNVILLILGFIIIGNDFGAKTIYTSILLPTFLWIFEKMFSSFESFTNDALLDVVCYCFVVSIGLSILFNMNASSGGLDIVAKIVNKFFHVELGKALSICGMIIAFSSLLAYDTKTCILSLLGTYFNGLILDYFIFGQTEKKRVCILSMDKEEEIKEWILHSLKSGATIYQAQGAYDMKFRNEIITIVDKQEYQKLMNYIIQIDPKAFVTVYTVKEIRYIPKI